MENLRKLVEKATVIAGSIGLALSYVPQAFASGGTYSPYGPYGPHIPEDTGFGSTSFFTVAAIVSYALGVGFLAYSKILRNKLGTAVRK